MNKISQSLKPRKGIEITNYLPLPPFRSKEFWSPWRITHIRQLAETGRATNEVWLPPSERSSRALDQLYLKVNQQTPTRNNAASNRTIETSVPFAAGYPLQLSAPLYLGDMSFGALSGLPNIAIARAADAAQVLAGTGEGGLLKEVAECDRITVQWASARFGVDMNTLSKGHGVVIKIGQGAKPGIGGHLPGVKVTSSISETRRIPAGTDAVSPAPHHDIYSIEDLGQRILALKEATRKPVFVKVGATNYTPYIASGVARMGASGIIIDGAGAGTGAAPSVVKNNVGIPVELAVASVDSILRHEGLRDNFAVIAAGKVSCPEDSLKLIALGADITSLGTAVLLALGCLMVHKCHIGFCPAVLTNKITDNPARILSLEKSVGWVTNLVNGWKEEMKKILDAMNLSSVRELRSKREFLLRSSIMNVETAEILGVPEIFEGTGLSTTSSPSLAPPNESGSLWGTARSAMLWEMAGTTGKSPGEAQISSMGSIGPPFVQPPSRISDWLVSDGAQVTRPSIDPYREEIEIAAYIAKGGIRLSAPFFFTHLPTSVPDSISGIFARTAASMSLLFDLGHATKRFANSKYHDRLMYQDELVGTKAGLRVVDFKNVSRTQRNTDVRGQGVLLVRMPSSEKSLDWVKRQGATELESFQGFIIDEDDESSDIQLELSVSLLDRYLTDTGQRWAFDILAEGNQVRGSEDIFKLLALGADAVGIGKAALVAVGFEEDKEIVVELEKLAFHLENLVVAFEKDMKLLAGAAGISSVSSSLVGNRELLRSVGLDPDIRKRLGIKPGGAF